MQTKMLAAVMLLAVLGQTRDYSVGILRADAAPVNPMVPDADTFDSKDVNEAASTEDSVEMDQEVDRGVDLQDPETSLSMPLLAADLTTEYRSFRPDNQTFETPKMATKTAPSSVTRLTGASEQKRALNEISEYADLVKMDKSASARSDSAQNATLVEIMRAKIPSLLFNSVSLNDSVPVFVSYNDDKDKYEVFNNKDVNKEAMDDESLFAENEDPIVLETNYKTHAYSGSSTFLNGFKLFPLIIVEFCTKIFTLFNVLSIFFSMVGCTIIVTITYLLRDLAKYRRETDTDTDNSDRIVLTETTDQDLFLGNNVSGSVGLKVVIKANNANNRVGMHQQVYAQNVSNKGTMNLNMAKGSGSNDVDAKLIEKKPSNE